MTTRSGTAMVLTALALLVGCGGSADSGSGTDNPAKATDTSTVTPDSSPADSTDGSPQSGSSDHKHRGHSPASAKDKRGPAPDDVISERPGGPKSPGEPQPRTDQP